MYVADEISFKKTQAIGTHSALDIYLFGRRHWFRLACSLSFLSLRHSFPFQPAVGCLIPTLFMATYLYRSPTLAASAINLRLAPHPTVLSQDEGDGVRDFLAGSGITAHCPLACRNCDAYITSSKFLLSRVRPIYLSDISQRARSDVTLLESSIEQDYRGFCGKAALFREV